MNKGDAVSKGKSEKVVVHGVFSEEPCECEVYCNCAQATLLEIYADSHKEEAYAHAARSYRGSVRTYTLQ